VRLFTAVELDPAVRSAAARAAAELRRAIERANPLFRARWIPEDNFHVTLVFLGEVPDARVPAVLAALEPPPTVPAFVLTLGRFGAFPATGMARILWLGVDEGSAALAALHGEVAARLQPLGFEPERRPYHAHLTLARVADDARGDRAIRRLLQECTVEAGASPAGHVTLVRSRLTPKGAVYEPLLRVPLRP
jgi:2'-5' RNA ligase